MWAERAAASARRTGGRANSPISFGIGADPGHHEQRRPSTMVPTDARGVAIHGPKVDRFAGSAARTKHVKPWRAGVCNKNLIELEFA
jgi:hypothetical protein